ncbi:MAG: LD-carboxypeptidase [Filifactor alocis]|nr:LD-carboxypeptidase [Filifactor alocis]
MRYPNKLLKGGTVGLVAPSSPISEEKRERCIQKIKDLGYRVKVASNLSENYGGYMAGDGPQRAKELNSMFEDAEVDAVFCVRGGAGGSRIMPYVDFELIKKNPKIFVGYSDITSLHLAINRHCDLVTFHGPMVSSDMIDDFDEETSTSFFEAINAEDSYVYANPKGREIEVLSEGTARGRMTGGNLALLSASIGTFYELDCKDRILFIEEVGEEIDRLERFAFHLKNAGKLDQCRGILLGQFTKCNNKNRPEYDAIECFKDILRGINIPVMYHIESGHGHPMMTLPMGAYCSMDTRTKTLYFEKPVRMEKVE